MFARLFAVVSLAALAVAVPAPIVARQSCSNGPVQCCQSLQDANQVTSAFQELGLIGVLAPISGLVGLGCSPITLVGGQCNQQVACCDNNSSNGVINLNCNNISI